MVYSETTKINKQKEKARGTVCIDFQYSFFLFIEMCISAIFDGLELKLKVVIVEEFLSPFDQPNFINSSNY